MDANIIDKIITFVNPEAGMRRMKARAVTQVMAENLRSYDAASKSRRTSGWRSDSSSSSAEISRAKVTVRNRMRELVRNDPYAKNAVRTIVGNVVGSGIRPRINVTNKSGKKTKSGEKLKSLWKSWAESTSCDFEERATFYGLQKLLMRTLSESGSAIVLKRRYMTATGLPLQIQILEPDYIDYGRANTMTAEGGYIYDGIEFDSKGKRVAYWLFDNHPGDLHLIAKSLTSRRVPAADVLHVFHVERPGQHDGMPLGVAGMLKSKDFNDYEDAQLVKQKIAACFAVFIQDSADMLMAGGSKGATATDIAGSVEPGIIEYLPPGKSMTFATPPTTEGYAEYTRTIQRGVAAGWGVTYEQFTNDLSNVNFSSGRMGWIESGKWFSELQDDVVIAMFCSKIFDWFVSVSRIIGLPIEEEISVSWTPPKREFIDPSKETEATIGAMRGGLKHFGEVALESGKDPEELMEQIAYWTEKAKALGLELELDPRYENKLSATDSRKF